MMALWAITSFKTLIPAALECPCGGTRLACGLAISTCTAHMAKQAPTGTGEGKGWKPSFRRRRPFQGKLGMWQHNRKCWWRICTKPAQPCHQDVISSRKVRRSPSHRNMGGDKEKTSVLLRRHAVTPEKQRKGCKTFFSVKALTYPKSTVDFHSLFTNTNTNLQTSHCTGFSFRDEGNLTDSRREPPLKEEPFRCPTKAHQLLRL